MRPDPLREGARWLEQADEDVRTAEVLVAAGRHYMACFVCQQAAEKALKGLLYALGQELVLGHSVEELARQAASLRPELEAVQARVAELDAYYIPTRYPNGLPAGIPARVFGQGAAERALALAREAVDAVRSAWPR